MFWNVLKSTRWSLKSHFRKHISKWVVSDLWSRTWKSDKSYLKKDPRIFIIWVAVTTIHNYKQSNRNGTVHIRFLVEFFFESWIYFCGERKWDKLPTDSRKPTHILNISEHISFSISQSSSIKSHLFKRTHSLIDLFTSRDYYYTMLCRPRKEHIEKANQITQKSTSLYSIFWFDFSVAKENKLFIYSIFHCLLWWDLKKQLLTWMPIPIPPSNLIFIKTPSRVRIYINGKRIMRAKTLLLYSGTIFFLQYACTELMTREFHYLKWIRKNSLSTQKSGITCITIKEDIKLSKWHTY